MRKVKLSIAIVISCVTLIAGSAGAQDITPAVMPDRLVDVADAPGSPFPRFDNFSWRAFIALNWPAMAGDPNRGRPDLAKKLADPGPRVWETYKSRFEVFIPGAPRPAAWDSYDGANPCGPAVSNRTKTLSAFSHFADYNQAAFTLSRLANPLVDQKRIYTRYEVRINREEFDSIRDNEWFVRQKLPSDANPGTFKDGSIELKAAWRVLNAGDGVARHRYYMTKAMVLDAAETLRTGAVVCSEQDVALVGLHIVIKTKLRPQWIWSSFEHVDNVRPKTDEPDAKSVPVTYSYDSGASAASITQPPPPQISDTNPPVASPVPTQALRLQPIQGSTMDMNRAYWALPEIKGTVWEHYMLVMTQWPSNPGIPSPASVGEPFPTGVSSTLANTTMETYQQRNGKSCMECHQEVANKFGRDFVAFMSFDASSPPLIAIATAAADAVVAARTAPALARARHGASSVVKPAKPKRTPLDDDPVVKALARMLSR